MSRARRRWRVSWRRHLASKSTHAPRHSFCRARRQRRARAAAGAAGFFLPAPPRPPRLVAAAGAGAAARAARQAIARRRRHEHGAMLIIARQLVWALLYPSLCRRFVMQKIPYAKIIEDSLHSIFHEHDACRNYTLTMRQVIA